MRNGDFATATQQRLRSRGKRDHHSGFELFDCVRMVHLQQNASQYVTRVGQRKQEAADLRAVFNAPGRAEADRLLAAVVKKYAERAPRLSRWLEENIPLGLTVMSFPVKHQPSAAAADDTLERAGQPRVEAADAKSAARFVSGYCSCRLNSPEATKSPVSRPRGAVRS